MVTFFIYIMYFCAQCSLESLLEINAYNHRLKKKLKHTFEIITYIFGRKMYTSFIIFCLKKKQYLLKIHFIQHYTFMYNSELRQF